MIAFLVAIELLFERGHARLHPPVLQHAAQLGRRRVAARRSKRRSLRQLGVDLAEGRRDRGDVAAMAVDEEEAVEAVPGERHHRSEEHTSELQSLMRISYAVFCLKKKKHYRSRQTRN